MLTHSSFTAMGESSRDGFRMGRREEGRFLKNYRLKGCWLFEKIYASYVCSS
jgi:hypothetical protein